jgi:predicted Zn-dependent protease
MPATDPPGSLRERIAACQDRLSAAERKVAGYLADFPENVVFSSYAQVTGGASTGHGVPPGWRFGALPAPSHLFLEPGPSADAQLLDACGDGLLVSRLDYLRVLHPKDTLVTGTTRDASCTVRGGRIVACHPQVRLTFRMDEVLRAVVAVGRDRERGEAVFMESVVAPSLVIDAGPIVV